MAPNTVAPTEKPNPKGYTGAWKHVRSTKFVQVRSRRFTNLTGNVNVGPNAAAADTAEEHEKTDCRGAFGRIEDV